MSLGSLAPRLQALRRRARRAAERLGAPGLLGAAILATCLGYYGGAVRPLAAQIDALEAMRAGGLRPRERIVAHEGSGALRRYAASFPDEREAANVLARLYALGERASVRLAQGEYRFVQPDALGMVQYKIVLPVSGKYPRIRQFIGAVLAEVPWISVTQVILQRERVGQGNIEARLELTLHLRAAGAIVARDTAVTEPFPVAREDRR